ncbi:hypothetical protein [Vibrio metschnikovii]|uniref:hypothetical protein n=1 Tax=Vibrio metschnikovii TaxID=28172 RepID=UPI002FC74DB6
MPSVLLSDNKVVAAFSFDPIEEKAVFTSEYRPDLVGKIYIDGVYLDDEPLSDGSVINSDGGGNVVNEK